MYLQRVAAKWFAFVVVEARDWRQTFDLPAKYSRKIQPAIRPARGLRCE